MAAEKSGYNIKVTCTQDALIAFACKSKQRPGIELGDKIETTTDASTGAKEFEPGDLPEVTDAQIKVADDFDLEQKIKAIIGQKGTITFTSTVTSKKVAYANAWFKSYKADDAGSNDNKQPEATITIQSGGGSTGLPAVSAVA